jgi:hypothetical protein
MSANLLCGVVLIGHEWASKLARTRSKHHSIILTLGKLFGFADAWKTRPGGDWPAEKRKWFREAVGITC